MIKSVHLLLMAALLGTTSISYSNTSPSALIALYGIDPTLMVPIIDFKPQDLIDLGQEVESMYRFRQTMLEAFGPDNVKSVAAMALIQENMWTHKGFYESLQKRHKLFKNLFRLLNQNLQRQGLYHSEEARTKRRGEILSSREFSRFSKDIDHWVDEWDDWFDIYLAQLESPSDPRSVAFLEELNEINNSIHPMADSHWAYQVDLTNLPRSDESPLEKALAYQKFEELLRGMLLRLSPQNVVGHVTDVFDVTLPEDYKNALSETPIADLIDPLFRLSSSIKRESFNGAMVFRLYIPLNPHDRTQKSHRDILWRVVSQTRAEADAQYGKFKNQIRGDLKRALQEDQPTEIGKLIEAGIVSQVFPTLGHISAIGTPNFDPIKRAAEETRMTGNKALLWILVGNLGFGAGRAALDHFGGPGFSESVVGFLLNHYPLFTTTVIEGLSVLVWQLQLERITSAKNFYLKNKRTEWLSRVIMRRLERKSGTSVKEIQRPYLEDMMQRFDSIEAMINSDLGTLLGYPSPLGVSAVVFDPLLSANGLNDFQDDLHGLAGPERTTAVNSHTLYLIRDDQKLAAQDLLDRAKRNLQRIMTSRSDADRARLLEQSGDGMCASVLDGVSSR